MKKWIIFSISVLLVSIATLTAVYFIRDNKLKNMPVDEVMFVDYVGYKDVDSITNSSDLIFIGEPVHELYYDPGYSESHNFYTLRKIKVIKMLKGDIDSKYISIRELAIYDGKRILKPVHSQIAEKGSKYIFFVVSEDGKNYIAGGPDQGMVDIKAVPDDRLILRTQILAKYADEIDSLKK